MARRTDVSLLDAEVLQERGERLHGDRQSGEPEHEEREDAGRDERREVTPRGPPQERASDGAHQQHLMTRIVPDSHHHDRWRPAFESTGGRPRPHRKVRGKDPIKGFGTGESEYPDRVIPHADRAWAPCFVTVFQTPVTTPHRAVSIVDGCTESPTKCWAAYPGRDLLETSTPPGTTRGTRRVPRCSAYCGSHVGRRASTRPC